MQSGKTNREKLSKQLRQQKTHKRVFASLPPLRSNNFRSKSVTLIWTVTGTQWWVFGKNLIINVGRENRVEWCHVPELFNIFCLVCGMRCSEHRLMINVHMLLPSSTISIILFIFFMLDIFVITGSHKIP